MLCVHRSWAVVACLSAALVGCGAEEDLGLVSVEGTVTLDGAPIEDAEVVFSPRNGQGRSAFARTDEAGHYELAYTRSHSGAAVGMHDVTISKMEFDESDDEDPGRETLPRRYQRTGELSVDVTESRTTYDFALDSTGG